MSFISHFLRVLLAKTRFLVEPRGFVTRECDFCNLHVILAKDETKNFVYSVYFRKKNLTVWSKDHIFTKYEKTQKFEKIKYLFKFIIYGILEVFKYGESEKVGLEIQKNVHRFARMAFLC